MDMEGLTEVETQEMIEAVEKKMIKAGKIATAVAVDGNICKT